MTDIDYLQETIGSILKQIDNAGRFKTLGLSRNQKPFDVDQTDILHNLVNGTGIDTPMEAFLYGKFRRTRFTLKWTRDIVKHYTMATKTGNFILSSSTCKMLI
jgi:hypothetical protein